MIKIKNISKNKNIVQSGQALLIVLLVMAVALTVVMSSVSRSVTDISVSEVEKDSSRAFSAAEAGIEEALLNPPPVSIEKTYPYGDGVEARVIPEPKAIEGGNYRYPEKLENGEEAIIWFIDHDPDNDHKFTCDTGKCAHVNHFDKLCWGLEDDYANEGEYPAVQLTFYYDYTGGTPYWMQAGHLGDFSNVKIATVGFDPNSTRRGTNGFTGVEGPPGPPSVVAVKTTAGSRCEIGEAEYVFGVDTIHLRAKPLSIIHQDCLNTPGCLIMAKIRMLYNDSPEEVAIQIPSDANTPQGFEYGSTGSTGQTQRKVEAFKSFAEPLDFLSVAVFSNDGLEK
ncbi:hypothetical protein JXA63_02750 [Candidatus Woesebacteria bacterium]|nr:hypothetical protein [Candidatus Woesebacteria bacterium]